METWICCIQPSPINKPKALPQFKNETAPRVTMVGWDRNRSQHVTSHISHSFWASHLWSCCCLGMTFGALGGCCITNGCLLVSLAFRDRIFILKTQECSSSRGVFLLFFFSRKIWWPVAFPTKQTHPDLQISGSQVSGRCSVNSSSSWMEVSRSYGDGTEPSSHWKITWIETAEDGSSVP